MKIFKFVLIFLVIIFVGCSQNQTTTQVNKTTSEKTTDELDSVVKSIFAALPNSHAKINFDDPSIQLGRMLYFEKRLSKDNDISCNSCHGLSNFGVDNEITSLGHQKQRGNRNSPTVYNAAGHLAQFWDGRAANIEEQAKGPILNPVEMAMPSEKEVEAVLKSIDGYQEAFKKAFPNDSSPITYNNMAIAIGAFERNLTTPSRFDDYLNGHTEILSDQEKTGLDKFIKTGCVSCHNGQLLGGMMYQKLGLVKPWPDQTDLGRYEITKNEAEKMFFKVPSLRNVEKTAPYFHNGSIATLNEAVLKMAEHQLGKNLVEEDVNDIVAFLKSLTGEIPVDYIKEPKLP